MSSNVGYNLSSLRDKEDDIFDAIYIDVNILPKNPSAEAFSKADTRSYYIEKISVSKNSTTKNVSFDLKTRQLISRLNKNTELLNKDASAMHSTWSAFYLIKEIVQQIRKTFEDNTLYFRGQSHDWDVLPGALRTNVSEDYANKFDDVYKEFSFEYEEIEYFPLKDNGENFEKRTKQIAKLQHYGLMTPLIDISTSPYVGMFFMAYDDNLEIPVFDILLEKADDDSIFQKVEKTHDNIRLKAQSGAFINFEKLLPQTQTQTKEIKKVPRIVIRFVYDQKAYVSAINTTINEIKDLVKNENRPGIQNLALNDLGKIISKLDDVEYSDQVKKDLFEGLKKDLLQKLKEFEYTDKRIFPDLANYADAIKTQYKVDETSDEYLPSWN
ncbi:FRG domain-containing protein [Periweissella cryptocerci]|uniref:FRG domain-containing protein n=1 Tax=Periweissella cryptocerci TaxID=2506420 RepID=A0A4P6YQU5_9LACO|nr:FRG domain-containing protein [Periweissella cryptocerci]QBO34977.1 FRG domain-containing protein [Periweissella cryptocerci]